MGIVAGAFRIVDDPQMLNYAESSVDYLRVCLWGTGGTWFFSLPLGKRWIEIKHVSHVGGFVGDRDDFGISLTTGYLCRIWWEF